MRTDRELTHEDALAKLARPCTAPGCWRLTTSRSGRCDEHPRSDWRTRAERRDSARASDARRPSASERGYDWRWHRLRTTYLAAHPLCAHCMAQGRVVPAEEVDHIVPLREGGPRLDRRNLQALCRKCHRRKTARERAGRRRG